MKQTFLIFITLLIIPTHGYAAEERQDVVATVFGKDISLEMIKQSPEAELALLIWTPIREEFEKTHDVEPTEEEIKTFTEFMDRSAAKAHEKLPEDLKARLPDPASMREASKPMYRDMVKQWRISKALYEEYKGEVIFQQANPMEPVGAYRKLLESHEAKGGFKIYDVKLRESFWEYYTRKHPFIVPPEGVDYSKPWWLQKDR